MNRPAAHFRIPQDLEDAYRAWSAPRFEGWIDAGLREHLEAELEADPVKLLELPDAEVVRRGRNLTLKARLADRTIWIKRFRPAGPVDRAMYAPRPGKAVYAWNAAMALLAHGFCTPRPLIGLRGAGRLGGAEGIAAFEEKGGDALSTWLGDEPPGLVDRAAMMRALGSCLRRFHDLGFRHRDLRRGNILAVPEADDWSFCFLDNNRLRIQKPLNDIQRLREVERLSLDNDLLPSFFRAYMPERDTESMARAYRSRMRYADRLGRLPFGRLLRKTWYYSWELRAFSCARRP